MDVSNDITAFALCSSIEEHPKHVVRLLLIHPDDWKAICDGAAYWRMDVDDFIVVTAWRQAAILADELRESS